MVPASRSNKDWQLSHLMTATVLVLVYVCDFFSLLVRVYSVVTDLVSMIIAIFTFGLQNLKLNTTIRGPPGTLT
jgi:hypothetical protein